MLQRQTQIGSVTLLSDPRFLRDRMVKFLNVKYAYTCLRATNFCYFLFFQDWFNCWQAFGWMRVGSD